MAYQINDYLVDLNEKDESELAASEVSLSSFFLSDLTKNTA